MKPERGENEIDIRITHNVVLITQFDPKWDDGYGSWDWSDSTTIVGRSLDDPDLMENLKKAIKEIFDLDSVKSGFQTPHFRLVEKIEKEIPIKVSKRRWRGIKIELRRQ